MKSKYALLAAGLCAALLSVPARALDTISATHVFPASWVYSKSFLSYVSKVNAAGKGTFSDLVLCETVLEPWGIVSIDDFLNPMAIGVTEGAMLGRVSAMFLTVNMGARPVGAALGGLVGTAWGEPACLLLALAGFGVQLAIILASPVSALRSLASAPAPASA